MTNIDVKWNFIITIIKLLEPKDINYNFKDGAVFNTSKFVGLCKWAKYE